MIQDVKRVMKGFGVGLGAACITLAVMPGCVTGGSTPPPYNPPGTDVPSMSDTVTNHPNDIAVFPTDNGGHSKDTSARNPEDVIASIEIVEEERGICHEPENCPCTTTVDCEVYDKKDLCGGVHLCIDGVCVIQTKTAVTCPTHLDPCREYRCDPEYGLCIEYEFINGDACDDEDPCTLNDICLVQICEGTELICDDEKPCTDDSCVGGECESKSTCEAGKSTPAASAAVVTTAANSWSANFRSTVFRRE